MTNCFDKLSTSSN
ncbi:hypothetical protein D030_1270A, partial [Vibrio parahaemolyticus AQ3810]